MDLAAMHDPMLWAVRPVTTGVASGWLALMDIQPKNASIELGNIWFGPRMQRTRAATEAIFLMLKLAADDLGYRRLVWKCNALNAPSKRAAERLGFSYEGRHRMHMVVKGRQRDTDWYSIVGDEWPRCRDAHAGVARPGELRGRWHRAARAGGVAGVRWPAHERDQPVAVAAASPERDRAARHRSRRGRGC